MGNGRFAFCHSDSLPSRFVIGLDSCRENLHYYSRAKLPNLLYIIASVQTLPKELSGLISHVTVNFPWGSLLESLLTCDPQLMRGIKSILRSDATMDIHLNSGALVEAGWTFEDGMERVRESLINIGWQINQPVRM